MADESPRRDRKDIAVGVTNDHIDAARDEWKQIGHVAFHKKYRTKAAAKFLICDPDGTEYDAKAILFAARQYAGLDGANAEFDGDRVTVQVPLVERGYEVREIADRKRDVREPDYWWSRRPGENLWMEITRRPDIGGDLKAPIEARGGRSTPGYALLSCVAAGDLVIHYNGVAEQIVGVSVATGEQYFDPILWAARGTSARESEEKPSWKPGLYVSITEFTPLQPPLNRAEIQQRTEAILQVARTLGTSVGGSLYFPFTKYGDGVRAYQSYFAKFPRDLLAVFPEVAEVIRSLGSDPLERIPFQTEEESVQAAVEEASGKRRVRKPGSKQGRRPMDPKVKAAIEAHAMNAATEYFETLGTVTDVSGSSSYDLVVLIDGTEWHVEVKGTSTLGEAVNVTPNEVAHAHDHPNVAMFIVSEIVVTLTPDGPITSGGTVHLFHPWDIEDGTLVPTHYEWKRPK